MEPSLPGLRGGGLFLAKPAPKKLSWGPKDHKPTKVKESLNWRGWSGLHWQILIIIKNCDRPFHDWGRALLLGLYAVSQELVQRTRPLLEAGAARRACPKTHWRLIPKGQPRLLCCFCVLLGTTKAHKPKLQDSLSTP